MPSSDPKYGRKQTIAKRLVDWLMDNKHLASVQAFLRLLQEQAPASLKQELEEAYA